MRNGIVIILSLLQIAFMSCSTGERLSNNQSDFDEKQRGDFRIMFYNVENLFDTFDDTLKNDNEFLPNQKKFWTWQKYQTKLNHIYKVIVAVGGWSPPEIVGLCEVENYFVLKQLLEETPLSKVNYGIIHKNSPDMRGIDVALLYQKDKFRPIYYRAIPINFKKKNRKTRDILYVKGVANSKDTLHVFINHWPSRWGGQLKSEPKRIFVASVLRNTVDSIYQTNSNANIIITGDFNDTPENKSINSTLDAKVDFSNIHNNQLYNLSSNWLVEEEIGTLKYRDEWSVFDQMIISGAMLNPTNGKLLDKDDAHLFKADFLFEQDEKFLGVKPYRTYHGYRYHGGFSDHLPIYLDLKFRN